MFRRGTLVKDDRTEIRKLRNRFITELEVCTKSTASFTRQDHPKVESGDERCVKGCTDKIPFGQNKCHLQKCPCLPPPPSERVGYFVGIFAGDWALCLWLQKGGHLRLRMICLGSFLSLSRLKRNEIFWSRNIEEDALKHTPFPKGTL